MVCYSPEKRQQLQQSQESKSPVKITVVAKNKSKRSSSEREEYTILKRAKITPVNRAQFCACCNGTIRKLFKIQLHVQIVTWQSSKMFFKPKLLLNWKLMERWSIIQPSMMTSKTSCPTSNVTQAYPKSLLRNCQSFIFCWRTKGDFRSKCKSHQSVFAIYIPNLVRHNRTILFTFIFNFILTKGVVDNLKHLSYIVC
jgi:hypothetical protein